MKELIAVGQGQLVIYLFDFLNVRVLNITNSKVRFWVTLVVCFLLGITMSYQELMTLFNNPSITNLFKVLTAGTIIFTSSQAAYKTYYENSTIQAKIRTPLY